MIFANNYPQLCCLANLIAFYFEDIGDRKVQMRHQGNWDDNAFVFIFSLLTVKKHSNKGLPFDHNLHSLNRRQAVLDIYYE